MESKTIDCTSGPVDEKDTTVDNKILKLVKGAGIGWTGQT